MIAKVRIKDNGKQRFFFRYPPDQTQLRAKQTHLKTNQTSSESNQIHFSINQTHCYAK